MTISSMYTSSSGSLAVWLFPQCIPLHQGSQLHGCILNAHLFIREPGCMAVSSMHTSSSRIPAVWLYPQCTPLHQGAWLHSCILNSPLHQGAWLNGCILNAHLFIKEPDCMTISSMHTSSSGSLAA